MTRLYITLIILAFLGLIILIPVKVTVSFAINDKDNKITLRYAFLKLQLYPTEKKEKKEDKPKAEKKKERKNIFEIIGILWDLKEEIKKGISKILYYIISHALTLNELNISAELGMDDAMKTAMIIGWGNAIVYNAIGLLDRFSKLKKWNVSMQPNFEKKIANVGIYCIISTNIAHVIVLGIIVLKVYLNIRKRMKKYRKGAKK
jgi:hypothetical protein